jgi:hypothetical protein
MIWKFIFGLLFAVLAIPCIVMPIIAAFSNPQLTQTQLLLANWPLYLGGVIFSGFAGFVFDSWWGDYTAEDLD